MIGEGKRSRRAAPLALLVGSIAFRLPAIVNAGTVDSDSAVVGLQAMHLLRHEWSPFLFGSAYQTSVDSFVAAGYFAVLGPSPFALLASTLLGHVIATLFAYGTLRRHLDVWTAALVTLPLVFTPSPVQTYILGPPRQAAITLVFASIWAIDGASRVRFGWLALAGGATLAGFACFADPYALLLFPALAVFLLLACFDPAHDDGQPRRVASRLVGATVGLLLGLVPLALLLRHPQSAHGEMRFARGVLAHNYDLLVDECLPWILSTKAFFGSPAGVYVQWYPRIVFHAVQRAGAIALVAGILFGGVAALMPSVPWGLRRLGVLGFALLPLALLSFLFSVMVMDLFSARYLAAVILAAPFALAPAGHLLGWRRLGPAIAPYVASAAAAGWIGYGELTLGARIVTLPRAGAADELALGALLAQRGITSGVADYWVAYRLTFLLRENARIVPIHASEDRYAPYRRTFESESDAVYVFDPRRSRESLEEMASELQKGSSPLGVATESREVGRLKVYFLKRRPRA